MDYLPKRIVESELMSVREADLFSGNNNENILEDTRNRVVTMFEKICKFHGRNILDLGCGNGIVTIPMAQHFPASIVLGVDASEYMLTLGKELAENYGLSHRAIFKKAYIPKDKIINRRYYFDAVFSRSTLHHFKNGTDFWQTIKDSVGNNGAIFVMDLVRPLSKENAKAYTEAKACPEMREMYFNSFLAAFRPNEVRDDIAKVGLTKVRILANDTHMTIFKSCED